MNQTILGPPLTFDSVISITQHPLIVLMIIITFLLPILIYIPLGTVLKGPKNQPLMSYFNFWYPVFIWVIIQSLLFLLLIILPIWLLIIP